MMRAMWLHCPEDEEASRLGDQYFWGRDLLVAPVVEKGAVTRRIYLPEGTWHDWWSGSRYEGPGWIDDRMTWIRMVWEDARSRLTLEPDPGAGGGLPVPRRFAVHVEGRGGEPVSLVYSGRPVRVSF